MFMYTAIADILINALRDIAMCHSHIWPILNDKPVVCKRGAGRATYFKAGARHDVIVFGTKMVAHKIEGGKADWLSTKEIQRYRYFNGDVSLMNVFAHTVCHEFAHLLQYRLYKRRKGSVHNAVFYQLLDECYEQGVAHKVKAFIEQALIAKGISLKEHKSTAKQLTPIKQWRKGDLIEFNNRGQWQKALVIRVNTKTVSAQPFNNMKTVNYWRIPFDLIKRD